MVMLTALAKKEMKIQVGSSRSPDLRIFGAGDLILSAREKLFSEPIKETDNHKGCPYGVNKL
jgi:hypothetical protein